MSTRASSCLATIAQCSTPPAAPRSFRTSIGERSAQKSEHRQRQRPLESLDRYFDVLLVRLSTRSGCDRVEIMLAERIRIKTSIGRARDVLQHLRMGIRAHDVAVIVAQLAAVGARNGAARGRSDQDGRNDDSFFAQLAESLVEARALILTVADDDYVAFL